MGPSCQLITLMESASFGAMTRLSYLLFVTFGRIGTEGRRRLEPHPDPGAAFNILARLAAQKRVRGYRDRAAPPRREGIRIFECRIGHGSTPLFILHHPH